MAGGKFEETKALLLRYGCMGTPKHLKSHLKISSMGIELDCSRSRRDSLIIAEAANATQIKAELALAKANGGSGGHTFSDLAGLGRERTCNELPLNWF
jgi:hypothetical protein